MKKTVFSSKFIPQIFLGCLFLMMIFTVFVAANDYGITPDETLQNSYGHRVLTWYQTLGKNNGFLHYDSELYMSEHGPFFEVIVAVAQKIFGHEWYTRAVVNGLAGVVGVLAIALCGYELGGYWLAFVAGLFLWLYPRFFGSIFNNSKDIPFATSMTLILWAVLLLVGQWNDKRRYVRNSILVGLCIGMALSIRVTAVMWYFMLFFIPAFWWLTNLRKTLNKEQVIAALKKQVVSALLIGVVSFLTMMILWPYIFLDPFKNLYHSIVVMQRYPWNGPVIFNGGIYPGQRLPWSYIPVWLAIGSPLIIVLFTLLGFLLPLGRAIKSRMIDLRVVVVYMALLVPVALMIVLHATLYDGPRQFSFLIPVMILIAAYGFLSLCDLLLLRQQRLPRILLAALVITTSINFVFVIKDMSDLHPYEYTYFNALVGGVSGANGKYDIDYWRICSKPAAQWLASNYQKFTEKQNPTVTSLPISDQVMLYLPKSFSLNEANPDFYVGSMKDHFDQRFPKYRIIHTESIAGQIPACVVKMRQPEGNGSTRERRER